MRPRIATINDLDSIVEMVLLARQESSSYMDYDVRKDKVEIAISSIIKNGIAIVSDGGFIIGTVGETWFSDDVVVEERLLYVKPEHRGQSLAYELIDRFLDVAKSFSPKKILVGGSLHPEKLDKLKSLYEKFGFKVSGMTMAIGG